MIKEPNVSGQFYSADPKELRADIEKFMSAASNTPSPKHIDIIIAPHAGYIYSGPVAGYSFKAVSQTPYKTIVILAPSHFYGFDGISIWEKGGFKTPLGIADVDEEFTKKLMATNPNFYFDSKAFEREHSLEVEIPFLQKTFNDFKIVPIVFGQPSVQLLNDFAMSLKETIGDRKDVLIVVSTDLSHYHDDGFAREMDARTIGAIKELNAKQIWMENQKRTMEMCGFIPVVTAILYAQHKGLTDVELLNYGNSGDVTGDKSSVVGYSAIAIYGK